MLGATASVLSILAFFSDGDVPRFTAEISSLSSARAFVTFIEAHDQEIISLDITCTESDTARCLTRGGVPGRPGVVVKVYTGEDCRETDDCPGTYWINVQYEGTDAHVANGPTGAGSVTVKGYFSVALQGVLGNTAPVEVLNVRLRGLNQADVEG